MQKTQAMPVQSLGLENPLEEEVAIHPCTLGWIIPWTEDCLVGSSPWGCKESDRMEHTQSNDSIGY